MPLPPRSGDIHFIENIFHIVKMALEKDRLDRNITHETFQEYSERIATTFHDLQSQSKVLGRLPFLPLLFLPPPAPGPMLIKALMFVRVIVLLYPNIEQGGRGIFSKRENSLFSALK